jgi:hypothetical protein
MMYLHEVASQDFVIVQAAWLAGQARQLIERLRPSHVIVHQVGDLQAYYLFTRREALRSLARAPEAQPVHEALCLQAQEPTAALDAYTAAAAAPERAVVVEEGQVSGFFDVEEPLEAVQLRGAKAAFKRAVTPVPRSLLADLAERLPLGQPVSLLVSLSAFAGTGAGLPLALPLGSIVDVLVQPKHGLVLEGSAEGSLAVTDEEETLPLQFKLRGTELGPARLRVLAFHQGQPLGALTLAPTVVPVEEAAEGQRLGHGQALGGWSVHQPDLSLLILEHQSAGQPAFTFRLTATDPELGLNLKPFGPVQLRMDPERYFQEFFQDIEDLPVRTAADKVRAEQRLAAKGSHLFETVMPEDLQVLLWSLRQRIRCIEVQSEEPWIPWELCKLYGMEEGRVVEGPFLCEAFDITRWEPGIGRQPALALRNIALVAPRDSELPFSGSESDYVLGLADAERQATRIPANSVDVRSALASGQYDAWHFTGHGGYRSPDPNRSAIYLENQEQLMPEDISGVVRNLSVGKPLVFLNACQIGRSAMSLTGVGGWAPKFLRAGAAAFIGAYWSVYDQPAHDFAQALYQRLLAGIPMGQAVREARLAIRPLGDPTWLAYTVYADPLAIVQ